jgi:hypothetical protein
MEKVDKMIIKEEQQPNTHYGIIRPFDYYEKLKRGVKVKKIKENLTVRHIEV